VVKLAGEMEAASRTSKTKYSIGREVAELTKLLATLEEERREAKSKP